MPVFALAGTVTVSFAVETILNFAGTPWKVTEVVPLRFVPVIVSVAPARTFAGATFAIVGDRRRQRQEAVLDEDRLTGGAQDLVDPGLRGGLVRALGHRCTSST